MKIFICIVFVCFFAFGCVQPQDSPQDVNKLPMYGRVKRTKEQLTADNKFIAEYESLGRSRKAVAAHLVIRGWEYTNAKMLDSAMINFNQAWLLDSLNADVYWGFADLLGMQGKFKESIPFFSRSLQINPANAKVWNDESTSYGNNFLQTKEKKYLDSTIFCLKKAVSLDPQNAQLYSQLSASYSYVMQKDSAKKYLRITERLDPSAVNPDVKKMLENK
jgi:tetratricopeptide (TPR) repeat protein